MRLTTKMYALLAIAGVAATAIPHADAATKIVYGSYSAPTSTLNENGILPWLEEAKRLSGGSITYEFIGGGALVGSKTTLPGIRDGIVDGGMIADLYHPTDLPQTNIVSGLGAVMKDARVTIAAATETLMLHCPECVAEQEKWNVKFLGAYSTSAYSLLCTKPLATLEDVKGKKIRAAGALGRLASALGMTAVNITITEAYEALQRGQVDCSFGPPAHLDAYSLGDVAKYITLLDTNGAYGGPMLDISLTKWKELSKAERKALLDAAPVGVAGAAYAYEHEDAVALAKSEKGYTVVQPSAELTAAVEAHAKNDIAEVIKTAESRGAKNAQGIVDAFLAANEKWTGIVAEVGDDQKAFEDALRREIYSKVAVD